MSVHFSLVTGRISLMVQGLHQRIHPALLFWIAEFDNFISFDELFQKTLRRLTTFLLVNNKLFGKLFLSVPIISDDSLNVTPVAFLVEDFNLPSWKYDNLTFYTVILGHFILIPN